MSRRLRERGRRNGEAGLAVRDPGPLAGAPSGRSAEEPPAIRVPPPGWGIRPGLALFLIALTAFFVRLLHVLSYESAPTNDMSVYVDMAIRRLSLANLLGPEGVCWFPPGYSIFMKPFFLLLEEPLALTAIRIAQAALGAWTCVLLYRLGARSFSRFAGLAAAAAAAFFPHFVFYTSAWMSETLFIALYFAALLCFLRAADRPRSRTLYAAGLACAAAMLVRPVAISLAPAALAAAWRSDAAGRGRLRSLAIILAGGATLLGPWALRNWIAHDRLVLIAPNGAFNLAVGNHPGATGRYTTPPSIDGDTWDRMEDYNSRALAFIVEDPWGALFVTLRLKWLAFWEMIPPWPLYSSNPQTYLGEHFFPFVPWKLVAPLGFAGLGALLAHRRRGWWIAPACAGAYLLFYLVYFGNARYRLPIEGFFLVWAGVLIATLLRLPRALRGLPARAWAGAAAILIAGVLAQSACAARVVSSELRKPGGVLASGGQFPILQDRKEIPLFTEDPLPVDRRRGRFLRLSLQAWRMGPPRDTPENGYVRIEYRDRDGKRLSWLDHATFYLEALPPGRWTPVTFRSHIPPAARTARVYLVPDPGSPDTVIIDQPILRYSPGNDLLLEGLFPYLRYEE